ncbi:MAG: hypothetical protein HYZ42_10660 [Bacteroidetes bacterium]|nr:hypothetical protein [Bacteroidota bacterium]
MYKITVGNKTMVGCNEDAWRLTPHIWFENAHKPGQYGATFTGSRYDGANGYAPQSGMNELGLTFSRLASHTPNNKPITNEVKKNITNPILFLKDILHSCKTVAEVKAYISQYDHSFFDSDVFIYIDKSGDYLVVEPFVMTLGHEPNYVLSNFCPSVTTDNDARKLDRFRNGVEFLKHKTDTSLSFCTALSDTMHVCREKIGDGTLLTSIWDLNNGIVNLYFYHQYKNVVTFNLSDELRKGDHILEIQSLFPPNAEFEKLGTYQIPHNNIALGVLVVCLALLLFFSSIYFLVSFFKSRKTLQYAYIQLFLFAFGWALSYYLYILCQNMYIFYFSSPYKDPSSLLISLASYIPFALLLVIIPLFLFNFKIMKEKAWNVAGKWLFTANSVAYIILLGLFFYWELFCIGS